MRLGTRKWIGVKRLTQYTPIPPSVEQGYNNVEWPWRYMSRSKVITCDTPSHASDHFYQIWKESNQNCRHYRADTIFKAEWPWKYRSRSKVITCETPSDVNDDLYQIWKVCKLNCNFFQGESRKIWKIWEKLKHRSGSSLAHAVLSKVQNPGLPNRLWMVGLSVLPLDGTCTNMYKKKPTKITPASPWHSHWPTCQMLPVVIIIRTWECITQKLCDPPPLGTAWWITQ